MTVSEIAIRILARPRFDNSRLGIPHKWIQDNSRALAQFWKDCGHALSLSKEDEDEFDVWLRCQHDIELLRRDFSQRTAS